jgi:calcineurin-like phosphoesterase
MDTDTAITRFITQIPKYFKLAKHNLRLNGIMVDINENTGKAKTIKRLNFSREEYGRNKIA